MGELTFLPDAHGGDASTFIGGKHTSAMLLAIEPLSSVNLTVWPLEGTLPLFHIVEEFTLVLAIVGPYKLAIPVHLVLDPVAKVDPTVSPSILALAMDLVV